MHNERREIINNCIQKKGEIRIKELEKMFPDVSGMTLRRDLNYLEEEGHIVRTWGGAKSIKHLSKLSEENYSFRENENINAKIKIAKKAVKCVDTGRSIYLDSGTTIMYLAEIIPDESYSIITSSPNIALEINRKHNPTITLIGGQLSRNNLSISGPNSINFVRGINFDIAFLAASGFSLDSGFTCGNFNECELKKHIIKKARMVIMLMDLSKINKNLPFTFAHLDDINILITENDPGEEIKRVALNKGVEIE
jgi:DeoR family transcriptional regulator, fructose operon transcriptional repressor